MQPSFNGVSLSLRKGNETVYPNSRYTIKFRHDKQLIITTCAKYNSIDIRFGVVRKHDGMGLKLFYGVFNNQRTVGYASGKLVAKHLLLRPKSMLRLQTVISVVEFRVYKMFKVAVQKISRCHCENVVRQSTDVSDINRPTSNAHTPPYPRASSGAQINLKTISPLRNR